jgi:hypothetical protein
MTSKAGQHWSPPWQSTTEEERCIILAVIETTSYARAAHQCGCDRRTAARIYRRYRATLKLTLENQWMQALGTSARTSRNEEKQP